MANSASPPFATSNGSPVSTGSSGGGNSNVMESRPQKMGADTVNTESVPAGGKLLLADPGPVSANISGSAARVGQIAPFKTKG